MNSQRRTVPAITAVHIDDPFWSPKQKHYREDSIDNAWNFVKNEIEDNEAVSGWKKIERGEDTPWNQANLGKVLEAVAYALAQDRNPELEKKMDYVVSAIAGAQQSDGYVNALTTLRNKKRWAHMDGQHEGYVAGHLIEAAVAYYEATGKREFLDVMRKDADYIYRMFIDDKKPGYDGHAGLEMALVRLYHATGDQRYLELSKEWIERRGKPWPHESETHREYFMDHKPIREITEITGHAVRTMFYLTGVTDVANETGDESLKDASRRLWDNLTLKKLYVIGAVGSSGFDDPTHCGEGFGPEYELPNHRCPPDYHGIGSYCESCATCGLIYWAHSLFLMDGKAEYIDVLERAYYNALLHGVSLDGRTTYYQNPLIDENNPRGNCWVCCPPCIAKTLLHLPYYIYANTPQDLYVNLFVSGDATINLSNGPVEIRQETQYPWDGEVRMSLAMKKPTTFTLRVRMPGWCKNPSLRLTGTTEGGERRFENGYVCITRKWSDGDTLKLDLPMPVERIEANPKVESDHGQVALQRGPIVYAFEGLDNEGDVDVTLPPKQEFSVQRQPDLLGGVVSIQGKRQDGRPFTALPFYVMANRGNSKEIVWVKQEGKTESPNGWDGKLYRPME